ncbi:phosphatidate cytidylyltransferase [Azoarcus sp. L1K30]|uniref:phosphatidate cytidylyltransferase n=1 Tax=Azoarcus sp. L1K30 TaxID=2820277 RepID=UPI001B8217C9|nr:phosphatidate cytidylyltransferase [Azoarcus sp. L1K30]MBR0565233.1 phosphatidate cytidylyltransferase [Azoarcus sp. L1K30]
MLRARIITALVLLFGLLAALFLLPDVLWLCVSTAVCAAAAWEWGGLGRFSSAQRLVFAACSALVCALAGVAAGLAGGEGVALAQPLVLVPLYAASAVFWLTCIPLWLRNKWCLSSTAVAMGTGLVVLVPPALALAHLRLISPWFLLGIMAMVWVADIAAYFSGRAFGRRKLAPAISPGKTWEGAFGATVGVIVFGYAVLALSGGSGLAWPYYLFALPLLLGFTAVSIIGDLFESLLKRQAGLKDSGTILPGHGGILDRIDSLTSTLPMAGLLALWLAS